MQGSCTSVSTLLGLPHRQGCHDNRPAGRLRTDCFGNIRIKNKLEERVTRFFRPALCAPEVTHMAGGFPPLGHRCHQDMCTSDWQASRSWRCSHQVQRGAATTRQLGCSPLMASTSPLWHPSSLKAALRSGSTLWRQPCLLQPRSTCTGYCTSSPSDDV